MKTALALSRPGAAPRRPAGAAATPSDPGRADTGPATAPPIPVAPTPDRRHLRIVTSGLSNASVSINGMPPVQLGASTDFDNLGTDITHTLLVRADGRQEYRTEIDLGLGDAVLTLTPQELPLIGASGGVALVRVVVTTPGARVFVDDVAAPMAGYPPARVLTAGPHTLTVKAPGKANMVRTINVIAGVDQTVSFGTASAEGTGPRWWQGGWGYALGALGVAAAVSVGLILGSADEPPKPPPPRPAERERRKGGQP